MKKEKLSQEELNKLKVVFCPEQIMQILNDFTVEQIRAVINNPSLEK